MHDSATERPEPGDAIPELAPDLPPVHSGLTRFLVENPSAAGISRETLVEAVRSLLRERDYLRRARDLALADFQLEQKLQREHTAQLEALQLREACAHQEQADTLRAERDKLQLQVEAHQDQALDLKAELEAHREELDALLAERQELLDDRDAWRDKANLSLKDRVKRTVRGWIKRPSRSA
ncbi:MAG: hypothetical protein ACYS26_11600 [Planctomycetota bacterium]|jgi:chromosome segregation ATPase